MIDRKGRRTGDPRIVDARWDDAIREAGHATIATLLGVPVILATIKPSAGMRGQVIYLHHDAEVDLEVMRTRIIVCLAGPIAASLLHGVGIDDIGNHDDYDFIFRAVEAEDLWDEADHLITYTKQLVLEHRDKILRVAVELYRRRSGTMNGYMVHRFTYHTRSEWRALRRKVLARRRARIRA